MNHIGDLLHPVGEERSFWKSLGETLRGFGINGKHQFGNPTLDFETWDSILELARMRAVAAIHTSDTSLQFVGIFGFALLVRYRWLKDARERGLSPHQARREFDDRVDRGHEIEVRRQAEMAQSRARQAREAERKRNEARRRPSQEAEL